MNRRSLLARLGAIVAAVALAPAVKAEAAPDPTVPKTHAHSDGDGCPKLDPNVAYKDTGVLTTSSAQTITINKHAYQSVVIEPMTIQTVRGVIEPHPGHAHGCNGTDYVCVADFDHDEYRLVIRNTGSGKHFDILS